MRIELLCQFRNFFLLHNTNAMIRITTPRATHQSETATAYNMVFFICKTKCCRPDKPHTWAVCIILLRYTQKRSLIILLYYTAH